MPTYIMLTTLTPEGVQTVKNNPQLELSYQSSSKDRAAVEAATATVAQRSAELRNAQSTEQRAMELTKQKLISKQMAETAATDAQTAAAVVRAAQANLEQATSALGKAGAQNAAVRISNSSKPLQKCPARKGFWAVLK
jgi:multidrug resistance efflux pump